MEKPQIITDKEFLYKELTQKIINCSFKIHNVLGPGYLEIIYRNTLIIELEKNNLDYNTERIVEIFYEAEKIGEHRLDLVIENKVIVELKAVSEFHPTHQSQIISYLKATGLRIGLLFNFGKDKVEYKRFIL